MSAVGAPGKRERAVNEITGSFEKAAREFMRSTERYVEAGVNPGGYYKAVWCRDASYILRDWFLSGRFEDVMREILFIWSHQIDPGGEKIIYGRGSPEMKYLSRIAPAELEREFRGALPTTIFRGFSEVYGQKPDIDSTALMVSATSWVLDAYIKSGLVSTKSLSSSASEVAESELKLSSVVADASTVREFVVPRMLRAVDYLASRDIDGDALLEQGHNEDWMDTVLRSGKIVYSQGCWISALRNLASLLTEINSAEEAGRLTRMAEEAIDGVENVLWSEQEGTYIDLQEGHHIGKPFRTLTQDVLLYLVAVTENALQNQEKKHRSPSGQGGDGSSKQEMKRPAHDMRTRAGSTLDAVKSRIWNEKGIPLVTEVRLVATGPWKLDPDQYHNHTFWPWMTGIEMLARSRFDKVDDCNALLTKLIAKTGTEGNDILAIYEWVHPGSFKGSGASPFRTGISAIRIALTDILARSESAS